MIHKKEHIIFLTSALNIYGGLERNVVQTANMLAEKGKDITLFIAAVSPETFYPVHKNITILQFPVSMGISQEGNMITRKLKFIKDVAILKKVLTSISASTIITSDYALAIGAFLAMRGKAKIYSREHSHFTASKKNRFWRVMMKLVYPRLTGIICLNNDERKLFSPFNRQTVVIPNFIRMAETTAALNNKTILTVAQLKPIKGISFLLHIADIVLKKWPDWNWVLIGDGPLVQEVNTFISSRKLHDRLILKKSESHILKDEYRNSSIYVMTSVNECFPNVLLEALSNGLPCIAFDCDTGPRNIIKHNEDGFLIEPNNINKMADSISSLIENKELRKKMGQSAVINVTRFNLESISSLWEKLIFSS